MTFRILIKSLRLAIRTGRRFLIFVTIYAVLMFWASVSLDLFAKQQNPLPMLLLLAAVAVVALVYGLLISSYRKTQVATLRCLGWTSGDIKWLFIGELMLVCLVAAFIDLEIVVHYLGIVGYFSGTPPTVFESGAFLISLAIILVMQLLGVLVAWNRMLKVRPMEALRKA